MVWVVWQSYHGPHGVSLESPGEADGAVALDDVRVGLLPIGPPPALHHKVVPFTQALREDGWIRHGWADRVSVCLRNSLYANNEFNIKILKTKTAVHDDDKTCQGGSDMDLAYRELLKQTENISDYGLNLT